MPIKPDSPRWKQLGTTPFPWEAAALTYLREGLNDTDPVRVWSLFEFVSNDGRINEVDALVLTAKGFFLVEIKSHPCIVTGDNGTWTFKWPDGRKTTADNPRIGADRKAKRLKALLERQRALREHRLPYLQELVFLSHEDAQIQLDPSARHRIHVRDRVTKDGEQRSGILGALTQLSDQDRSDPRRPRIDSPLAAAISRAMEQAGIRPSTRQRRFGTYELGDLLLEGPGYQDWLAKHTSIDKLQRRVRIYPTAPDTESGARQMLHRAAKREFTVLQGIQHQGILPAVDFHEGDQGPGLIFDYAEDARRLDHFLREESSRLTLFDRLDLLRQIAEALHYAHEKRLVHRAISPLSVLVQRGKNGKLRAQLYNWQAASRDSATTTQATTGTLTVHVEQLVEEAAQVYLAPETLLDPSERAEHLDVFGLGALAYLLFADRAPADDHNQLRDRLARERGLLLSSAVDGAAPELVELIRAATHPEVPSRLASIGEFLLHLDQVEEALTRPEIEVHDNPTEATVGQRFPDNYVVKGRLGKGSSAVVFLVEKAVAEKATDAKSDAKPEQVVLKLALDPQKNGVLEAEAKVLETLRHPAIVRCLGRLDVGGHHGILLDRAGQETLADRLRKEGPIALELLQRFGDDLLGALQYLEDQGLFHRDIKPDNIGVTPVGRGDSLHLVLFDFSLANAPAHQVQAGTRAYMDPFLGTGRRRQYDPAAERYAAAVTLYEMATGNTPRWGDGRSDPSAAADIELNLDDDAFDPAIREPLASFFKKALHRDFQKRFDNAEEMKASWHALFEHAASPALPPERESDITLDTPLRLTGLSNRAVNVLERDAVETVRSLLELPLNQITHRKGVGTKTRQELLHKVTELRRLFPDVQPVPARAKKRSRSEPSDDTSSDKPTDAQDETTVGIPLDQLAERLVIKPRGRGAAERREPEVLRCLLAAEVPETELTADYWPTQTEVAKATGLTTMQVHQLLKKARERWRKLGGVSRIRGELQDMLRAQGGITSLGEAIQLIANTYGQGLPEPALTQCSRQVLRAVLEAEQSLAAPRFEVVRRQERVWFATAIGAEDREVEPAVLVRYAQELGKHATRLAHQDPLPSPQRVLEDLREVEVPAGMAAPGSERLVRLAATAGGVAVSVRLELYPPGMDVERTLRLAQGALLGATTLTTAQLRERIAARFPEAEPLPTDRHRLGAMLAQVLPDLHWDDTQKLWRFHIERSSSLAGEATIDSSVSTWARPSLHSPEVSEARQFEDRLSNAKKNGHFLVLAVERKNHEAAIGQLTARFSPEVVSVESLFLRRLRHEAAQAKVPWSKVLNADASSPDSRDWRNLVLLAQRAAKGLGDAIGNGKETVLATRLGILQRYGLLQPFVERLRERTQLRPGTEGALHGTWLLIATYGTGEKPTLDGEPIPVIDRAGWADVPSAWIQDLHREKSA
ncbi:MAG: BREX system serine/threonine kinase PglW [Planctomycetota bacterium]